VIACATHTHSGPDTLGLWGRALLGVVPVTSGVDARYMECLVEEVAACVDRAAEVARPARLRAASFEVPEHWTRNDRHGGARFDQATALALDDATDGSRLATLVCYASHPETLWRDNRLVSPDFPGAFRRRSQELAGGTPLYLSGPLGAMLTPNVPPEADPDERQRFCEALGRTLAEHAEASLAQAPVETAPRLAHAVTPVRLRNGNWRFRMFQRLGFLPGGTERDAVVDDVHLLRVGELELLATPGELAPEVGARLRDLLSARHRMVVSLCDDEIGYVLEPRMFADREYRYERSMSLGPETAARLLEACGGLIRS
jgi:hypothetical protein